MSNERLRIEARGDGIYAIIDNSVEPKITRKELLEMIERYRVSGVDFEDINAIFKSEETYIEKKISSVSVISARGESCILEADKDRMEIYARFSQPEFGGKCMTADEILNSIKNHGVTFGILEDEIKRLAAEGADKNYDDKVTVAKGQAPVDGVNGELIYNFDTSGQNRPQIKKDGTVDYRQMDYFQSVKQGQVLAQRTDFIPGEPGINVFSRPMPHKPGKPAPKFSIGKGCSINDDETEVIAEVPGQLVYTNGKISVTNVLDVKGDVGYETGNIEFEGSVLVAGNVVSGFSINAIGNIEIKGVVEAATVTATGSVHLYGGVQGLDKAVITGGDIFTKFAQNANLVSRGNIVSGSLMHCQINCDGSVLMDGENNNIVGGRVFAGNEIIAKTIGSPMATKTLIKVGSSPEMLKRFEDLKSKYEEARKAYTQLNESYESIMKTGNVESFDERRKSMLFKIVNSRTHYRELLMDYENELKSLAAVMRRSSGRITAEKICHYGVSITMSNTTLVLNDDIKMSVFTIEDEKIKITSVL